MLTQTRRHALGLLIGTVAGTRLVAFPLPAIALDHASEDEASSAPDCFDTKSFGRWSTRASDISVGILQNEIPAVNSQTCDLLLSIEAGSNFAARIVIEDIAAGTALSDALLRNPESSFMAKGPGCMAIVETPLCGNCTDIYDNTVGIVLPLATAPLRRNEGRMEIVLHLADDDEDCRFKIDCGTMRQALDWVTARPDARATKRDNK